MPNKLLCIAMPNIIVYNSTKYYCLLQYQILLYIGTPNIMYIIIPNIIVYYNSKYYCIL